MKTKWDILLPLLITTAVVLLGWFVGHYLSSRRDQTNKRRELRVQHLLEAYQNLMSAACYQKLERQEETLRLFTKASANIQLFGNDEQIQMMCRCTDDYATGNVQLAKLLNNLRSDLRKELKLPVTEQELHWLTAAKKKQVQNSNK
jgi:hypothetical protein